MPQQPPKFVTWLFRQLCRPDFYEELQGDLEERFFMQCDSLGERKARAIYRKEMLKMFRPSVLKAPSLLKKVMWFALLNIHMKLAFRNLARNKVFSTVNILGLAAAISVSLFLINMLVTGYSMDTQHKGADRIYRVVNDVERENSNIIPYASVPFPLAGLVRERVPNLEAVSHVRRSYRRSFNVLDEELSISSILVDPFFFEIFDIEVVAGDVSSLFGNIHTLAITDELANRLFPGEDPIGKTTVEGDVISVVLRSLGSKSHLHFDLIGSIERSYARKDEEKTATFYGWNSFMQDHVYVRLDENSNNQLLDERLASISREANGLKTELKDQYSFTSEPIIGISFAEIRYNELGSTIGREGLYIFGIMIIVLLGLAGFNYTNLSIARAIQRTREIGIRKVSGSTRGQIIAQFLVETVLFSGIALFIGYGIYRYFTEGFLAISDQFAQTFDRDFNPTLLIVFVAFSIVVGVVAGIFPALYFSRVSVLNLFNNKVKTNTLSFITIRKGLLTFQLLLSLLAVIFVSLVFGQYQAMRDATLGFETDGRLLVYSQPEKVYQLEHEVNKIAGVAATTVSLSVPGSENQVMLFKPLSATDSTITATFNFVNAGFKEVYSTRILSGPGFSDTPGLTEIEILANEQFLSSMEIPLDSAVGYLFKNNLSSYKVVGILSNDTFQDTFGYNTEPMIIGRVDQSNIARVLTIRTKVRDLKRVMTEVEAAWDQIHPDENYNPELLESHVEARFTEFYNMLNLFSFLAIVITLISILGQLGMAMYNAETRIKEIGVRKVLGAPLKTILKLLLKSTVISLVVAALIAGPVASLLFDLGFRDFRIQAVVSPYLLGRAILPFSALVLGIIIYQTWRVARINPAESLRSE